MFTGLVQALGIVSRIVKNDAGKRFTVSLAELAHTPISKGDSICVSGVCLTVTSVANGNVHFDVVTETLRHSTLDQRHIADRLNLELSLRADSYVGGHFVQGHIDAVGTVVAVQNKPEDWRITIEAPPEHMAAIVPKGSIAIDGVSMTIAAVEKNRFTVAVIPTTLEHTTLGSLAAGGHVNIETDILARTVVHWLELQRQSGHAATAGSPAELIAKTGSITHEHLVEHGFA